MSLATPQTPRRNWTQEIWQLFAEVLQITVILFLAIFLAGFVLIQNIARTLWNGDER